MLHLLGYIILTINVIKCNLICQLTYALEYRRLGSGSGEQILINIYVKKNTSLLIYGNDGNIRNSAQIITHYSCNCLLLWVVTHVSATYFIQSWLRSAC